MNSKNPILDFVLNNPYAAKVPSEPMVSPEAMQAQFQRNHESLMKEFGDRQPDLLTEMSSKLLDEALDVAPSKSRDMKVFGTSTGRMRYQSPELHRNPDSFPKDFKAEGSFIVDADLSKLEKRFIDIEGEPKFIIDAYNKGPDEPSVLDALHAQMVAAHIYGKPAKSSWSSARINGAATGSGKRNVLRAKSRAQKKARRKQR